MYCNHNEKTWEKTTQGPDLNLVGLEVGTVTAACPSRMTNHPCVSTGSLISQEPPWSQAPRVVGTYHLSH